MRRRLGALLVLALALAGINVLADLTQDRPDHVVVGSRTEVVLEVRARGGRPATVHAVEGLWGACQGTVVQRLDPRGIVDLGRGRFGAVTDRALGEHDWRRLEGCLEDLTVDRLQADVRSKRTLARHESGLASPL